MNGRRNSEGISHDREEAPGDLENCRRQYEEAQRQFETLIGSAPDALVFVDREGTIILVNGLAERMFGYGAGDLAGRNIEVLIPERHRLQHKKDLRNWFSEPRTRAMGSGVSILGLRKDGTEFPVDISLSPMDLAGEHLAVAAVRDISRRKAAEERVELNYEIQRVLSAVLKRSLEPIPLEEQLEGVLDLILSVPGLSFQGKGAIYLLDEGSDELVMKAERAFPREHRIACGTVPLGRCVCGEAALSRTVRFTDEAGHGPDRLYLDVAPHGHYCVPIVSEDRTLGLINVFVGEEKRQIEEEERFLVAVAATLAGSIERSRAEQALQDSEEKYRSLVENLNVGVYRNTPGPEGRFLHANSAVARIFGFASTEELKTVSVASLYRDPEERAGIAAEIARAGYVRDRELRLQRKDGIPIWASFSARAQYDEHGKVLWFDGVVEDITQRKWAEREKQELQERLHLAEKLSALGRFTLDVAHQIRNPLTVVGGFARRLSKELEGGGRGKEYADIIASETTRLEGILRNVLTLTESRKPKRERVDLNAIVGDVVVAFEGVCRAQGIAVETTYGAKGEVSVEPVAAKEAIENVVANAIDAMRDGGTLTIVTRNEEQDGRPYAAVEIVDDGPGIADENFGKIWEPFFTTKIESMGTGLGLPIAKKIVEDHGGFVGAHSQTGKGSMFTLYFPLSD